MDTQLIPKQSSNSTLDQARPDPFEYFKPQHGLNSIITYAQPLINHLSRLKSTTLENAALTFTEIVKDFYHFKNELEKSPHVTDVIQKAQQIIIIIIDNVFTARSITEKIENYTNTLMLLRKHAGLKKSTTINQIAETLNAQVPAELECLELIYLSIKLGWSGKSKHQASLLPVKQQTLSDELAHRIFYEKKEFKKNLFISSLPHKQPPVQKIKMAFNSMLGIILFTFCFAIGSIMIIDYSLKPLYFQLQTIEQHLP